MCRVMWKQHIAQMDSAKSKTDLQELMRLLEICLFFPFFPTKTSLVSFFSLPMEIVEALESGSSEGVGLLVDAKRGLILTDRHSAPQSLGATEAVRCG